MKKKIEKLRQIAGNFEIQIINGFKHVLSSHVDREKTGYDSPNFRNTGKALVGILHNQTLSQFGESWVNRKMKAV